MWGCKTTQERLQLIEENIKNIEENQVIYIQSLEDQIITWEQEINELRIRIKDNKKLIKSSNEAGKEHLNFLLQERMKIKMTTSS